MSNIKRKVLLICSFFFPDTAIAAVRMSNFATNLQKMGYDVTVLYYGKIHRTYDSSLEKKIFGIKVIKVNNPVEEPLSYQKIHVLKFVTEIIEKVIIRIFPVYLIIKNFYSESRNSKKRFDEMKNAFEKMEDKKFDLVMGTYSCIENLYIAKYISETYGCPYILDFRDGISQNTAPWFIEKQLKMIQDELVLGANAVTSISEPLTNWITPMGLIDKSKLFTITNGYEKIAVRHEVHKELTFCFTGNAFYKEQTFDPIFKALYSLINKKLIDKENVKFLHAGLASRKFKRSAKKFKLGDIAIDYGYVNSNEVLKIQSKSDIFVNIIWNNDEYSRGNISGKFYEGIKCHLPILVISMGKQKDCYLKELNSRYGFGYVYEEAYGEKSQGELEDYILECYNKKMSNKKILDPYPKQLEQDFEYSNITKKLDTIIKYSIETYKGRKNV